MVTVMLYGPVRDVVGQKRLDVAGDTVDAVLASARERYPDLGESVFAGEELGPQVQVFVDGRKIGTLEGLETGLSGDETVQVTQAMSGG